MTALFYAPSGPKTRRACLGVSVIGNLAAIGLDEVEKLIREAPVWMRTVRIVWAETNRLSASRTTIAAGHSCLSGELGPPWPILDILQASIAIESFGLHPKLYHLCGACFMRFK